MTVRPHNLKPYNLITVKPHNRMTSHLINPCLFDASIMPADMASLSFFV